VRSTRHRDRSRNLIVSFDIHLQGFVNGDAARSDDTAVLAALEPFIQDRGPGWFVLVTADGRAEVYASDLGAGVMFTHASGRAVWDVIYAVAVAGNFAVIAGGLATCVLNEAAIAHLPPSAPPAVVITSGEDLVSVVESL